MGSRHAYLIMAHENSDQLLKLIKMLDDSRNDIFIHIDADAVLAIDKLYDAIHASGLYFTNRISVKWAEYSQVKAELMLLKNATEHEQYHYYHLLSGQDVPLKTIEEIYNFFKDKTNEFIGIVPKEGKYQIDHVRYYYPLLKLKRYRKSQSLKALSQFLVLIQKIFGVNKLKNIDDILHFYDGWTWFSITDDFARYVVAQEGKIESIFKWAKAPDEMILQTLAMNSSYKERLYSLSNLQEGSMRMIDWNRGKPYTFQPEDFNAMIQSPFLFARKVDAATEDGGVLMDMIYTHLKDRQCN